MNRLLPRLLMAPAVVTLFLWMIVPLVMTLYFSVVRYNLMQPGPKDFLGLANFEYFVTDPDFSASVWNTLLLLGSALWAALRPQDGGFITSVSYPFCMLCIAHLWEIAARVGEPKEETRLLLLRRCDCP